LISRDHAANQVYPLLDRWGQRVLGLVVVLACWLCLWSMTHIDESVEELWQVQPREFRISKLEGCRMCAQRPVRPQTDRLGSSSVRAQAGR
jgi:hypothetical protein